MLEKISSLLLKLQPENAHSVVEFCLRNLAVLPIVQDILAHNFVLRDSRLANTLLDLSFDNPVGLAAGFDKNATMCRGLSLLGFGFLEIGTITQNPQSGNPKPRIFRFLQERSLQNCMGFNNQGVQNVTKHLQSITPFCLPLGINIGKNKIIAQDDSLRNYENALKGLLAYGDYFVLNVSSPNTPQLRDLQNKEFIGSLCNMARSYTDKPIFIKLSPDMHTQDLLEVIQQAIDNGVSGIIATNTTTNYSLLQGSKEEGGISGEALREYAKDVFRTITKEFFGKTLLISVGGIANAQEAYERLKMGASLIQVYTGLIYEGPGLIRDINLGILGLMSQDGFEHISQVIGSDYRKTHENLTNPIESKISRTPTKKNSTQDSSLQTKKRAKTRNHTRI